mmetsp:Transcript_34394/g.71617  ORF Transcript_34394/g.71617 Transcript_34394/m.71617 type:complete len:428 (+) Transcript_34394:260-1543(+)
MQKAPSSETSFTCLEIGVIASALSFVKRLRKLFLQASTLEHFLFRKTDSLLTEFPNLFGVLGVCYSTGLVVLENFSARSTSTSWLSILAPSANSLGTTVPAPVDVGLAALRIVNDLRQSLPSFFHANVPPSDILHEPREGLAEPSTLFTEQGRFSNASWVHGRECDASGIVVATVQFRDSHHVANLRVLVCFGTKERFSIRHGNRLLHATFQPFEGSKISLGVDETSTDSVGVSSNGTDDTDAGILGTRHVVQKQVHKEEMPQMVHTHTHFEAVVGPGRFWVRRSVHSRIAHQICQWTSGFESFQVGNKITNTLQTCKFEFHGSVRSVREIHFLGNFLHLFDITNSQDNKIAVGVEERLRTPETQSRRSPSHNNKLSKTNLKPSENLWSFLFFGQIKLFRKFSEGLWESTKLGQRLLTAEQWGGLSR